MARSLKKGPFADASLLKKVDAMNAAVPSSKSANAVLSVRTKSLTLPWISSGIASKAVSLFASGMSFPSSVSASPV